MNKKYGITAIIVGVIIVGVLAIVYGNNVSTNSIIQNQQPSTNSTTIHPPANTTGKHISVGISENVKITTNP